MDEMSPASTYAVSWHHAGSRYVGYAQLRARALRLEGRSGAREELRAVQYRDIVGVDVRRESGGRGIALALADGEVVTISSLDGPGSLGELADRIRTLTDSPQR